MTCFFICVFGDEIYWPSVSFAVLNVQGACVQNVLDSLIPALLADKNRKFIYVEQVGEIPIFLIF